MNSTALHRCLVVIFFLHTSACFGQQKILLIGTKHQTPDDRVKEMAPIAAAVEDFHPEIICTEYLMSADTASLVSRLGPKVFQSRDSMRQAWRIPAKDLYTKFDSLRQDRGLLSDIQKMVELQQLYFLTCDNGNADYLGYLVMSCLENNINEVLRLRDTFPGFILLRGTYLSKQGRINNYHLNNEYYRLVFPLAAKLKISNVYPIDDLSTWSEYEKYFERLQDTTYRNGVNIKFNRQSKKHYRKFEQFPKDSNQWIYINSPSVMREFLHAEGYNVDDDPGNDDFRSLQYYWALRNKTIAQHIDAVAYRYPDLNIAVFIGAAHVAIVQEELNKQSKKYQVLTLFDVMK